MSGSGPPRRPGRRSVHLSRDAEAAVRALPPVARRGVTDALDRLQAEGLPRDSRRVERHVETGGPEVLHAVPADDHELLVLSPGDGERLLVVRVEAVTSRAGAAAAFARALPIPARLRPGGAALPGDLVGDLVTDVRFALRIFRRSPGFALSVILTLTLAMGGTTALVGLVDTVFRSALPFADGDRLVRLRSYAVTAGGDVRGYNMTPRDFHALRDGSRVFTGVVGMSTASAALIGGAAADEPEQVSVTSVSGGWSEVIGVAPVLGRGFTADEETAGRDAGVVLVSHELWERRLGSDPGAVGRSIAYDGGQWTVVGVMPPRFHYPYDADLWAPAVFDATDWQGHDLNVVARLAPGRTVEDAREDGARIYAALAETEPVLDDGIEVTTARQDFIRDRAAIVRALMAAVAFLLLLACVNVANLLTARFAARSREIAVRAALGAGRTRQLRQFLTETVLLFLAGGAGGLLVAALLDESLSALVPDVLRTQLAVDVRLSAPVVGVAVLIAVMSGLVFGLAAALRGSRADLRTFLTDGGRGASVGGGRLQRSLVVGQLALSLVLLVGAGVLFDHFSRLRGADPGFEVDGVTTLRVSVRQDRYAAPEARLALLESLEARIAALPEVDAVGVTSVNPFCCGDWGASIEVEGLELPDDGAPILIHHRLVSPGYFDAMGIPLVRGRGFGPSEDPTSAPTVVIDDRMARRFWPGQDPIGKRVRRAQEGSEWRTVIGVVGWVEKEGDYTETWYLPMHQDPTGRSAEELHVMVRLRGTDGMDAVRRTVLAVDPHLPVHGVATMASLRRERLAQDRLGAVVSAIFAGTGLLLAGLGLYGLLSYLVTLRAREIGTRMALGADRGAVLGMILRQAGVLALAGVVLGVLGGVGLNRLLAHLVLGVRMADPPLLFIGTSILAMCALVAAAVPALRAAGTSPTEALKES